MVTKGAYYRQVIMQSLHITEERYTNLFLDEGEKYLAIYLESDHVAKAILQQCPAYWAWWQRQWDLRNYRFLQAHDLITWGRSLAPNKRMELQEAWYAAHDATSLTIRAPRRVFHGTGPIITNAVRQWMQ